MRAFDRLTVVASVLVAGVAVGLEIERARAARQPKQLPLIPPTRKEVGLPPTPFVPATPVRSRRSYFEMTRKKKAGIVLAVLVVMAVAATAVAAIVLYKDSSGAVTGGKIESATAGTALVVTANGALPDLVKANNVNWPLKATNQDAQLPHTPQSWTAVATVPSMPACDAAISVTNVPTFPLTPVAAGASVTFNANISVNASLPVGCAGKDVLLTIGGTTT